MTVGIYPIKKPFINLVLKINENKMSKVVVTRPNLENPASGLVVVSDDRTIESCVLPDDHHILAEMIMRPINPADIFSIMGVYPGFTVSADGTSCPGLEGVGIVRVGSGKVPVGSKVVCTPWTTVEQGQGTWQKYLIAHEDDVVVVPEDCHVDDASLAQMYVNPVTAYGMLRELEVPCGEMLLQTAGGSVLGRMVIQMCHKMNIKTINVVRRQDQVEELKQLGADHVIVADDDTSAGITEEVMKITSGKGAYGAIECVGGTIFKACASSVRVKGTILIYGAMSGLDMTVFIPDPLFRGISIKGWWLANYIKEKTYEEKQSLAKDILELIESKTVEPCTWTIYELKDVAEAIQAATRPARGGKILLRN